MMSDYGGRGTEQPIRHIDEQIKIFRKQLLSQSKTFHKFSSELPYVVYKNKLVQQDTINLLDDLFFKLKRLLTEIMENDISGETIQSTTYCKQCGNEEEEGEWESEEEEE